VSEVDTLATQMGSNGPPTPDELFDRARALVPVVRGRSVRCEELRRLPEETVADFLAAGLHKVTGPLRFGGYGYDLDLTTEIAMEIGRGCGSSGWLASFYSAHSFEIGWFSEQGQAEYWSTSPDVLSVTASAISRLEREDVDGGVVLSGHLRFSSGVDYADWVLLQTPKENCLVPRSDYTILDDWFVSGLRGTGSKSIAFDRIFVPDHRIATNEALAEGTTYGAFHYDSPYYKLHRILTQPTGILAPIIGMAQGVVDVFDERARTRKEPQTQLPARERPGTQRRFAESSAEVDLARLLLRRTLAECANWGSTGHAPTMEERARNRRTIAYATKLCTRAVDRLVESGDSSAVYEVNSLHRLARDTRAGALQFVMAWDECAIQYSRVRWGLEPQTLVI
jgi:alkylation response protein AidB-like acyl-CoA dehydrogenase